MKQYFRADLEIRPFQESDRYDVATLIREVLEEHDLMLDPGGLSSDLAKIAKRYDGDGAGFWVLLDDGNVIGTVAIRPYGEYTAEIERLYLHPKRRGIGLGWGLIEFIEDQAKKKGYRRLFISCSKKFPKAQDFLESVEYRMVGNAESKSEEDLYEKELY
jgi:putative acetyltransferase